MKKFFLIFILFSTSCVEHKFSFTVSPDGSYQVEYKGHGDKNDLIDFDFPLPMGAKWIINSTLENAEAESYDYTAHRLFNRNENFPYTFYEADSIYFESLLKHQIKLKHRNYYFRETYSFNVEIVGREVGSKYPKVGQFILDTENPPVGWLKEALMYLLTETLNQADIEWNTRPIIMAELNDWKKNELGMVSDSTLIEEIDYYKNMGLDIIMQPVSPYIYNEMDSIFKSLEDELHITLDLIDDSFSFQLILPGNLEFSNTDSIAGDTLFWSFELQDYMNKNIVMKAQSKINYPSRQKAVFFIGFTTIVIFIGLRIRRRNK